jgi:hypothetical protein
MYDGIVVVGFGPSFITVQVLLGTYILGGDCLCGVVQFFLLSII